MHENRTADPSAVATTPCCCIAMNRQSLLRWFTRRRVRRRYASRRKSGSTLNAGAEQMDKRLQARKQAQLAQNDGPENIAERVNQILEQALRQRASIFISSPRNALTHPPAGRWRPSRPTVAGSRTGRTGYRATPASLDIAEHRLPQDGQFALNLAGRPLFSHRHSALPLWRKIVLRLLHQVDRRWIWKHSDSHPPSWRPSPR